MTSSQVKCQEKVRKNSVYGVCSSLQCNMVTPLSVPKLFDAYKSENVHLYTIINMFPKIVEKEQALTLASS